MITSKDLITCAEIVPVIVTQRKLVLVTLPIVLPTLSKDPITCAALAPAIATQQKLVLVLLLIALPTHSKDPITRAAQAMVIVMLLKRVLVHRLIALPTPSKDLTTSAVQAMVIVIWRKHVPALRQIARATVSNRPTWCAVPVLEYATRKKNVLDTPLIALPTHMHHHLQFAAQPSTSAILIRNIVPDHPLIAHLMFLSLICTSTNVDPHCTHAELTLLTTKTATQPVQTSKLEIATLDLRNNMSNFLIPIVSRTTTAV
jgi:hypothetical protein